METEITVEDMIRVAKDRLPYAEDMYALADMLREVLTRAQCETLADWLTK